MECLCKIERYQQKREEEKRERERVRKTMYHNSATQRRTRSPVINCFSSEASDYCASIVSACRIFLEVVVICGR